MSEQELNQHQLIAAKRIHEIEYSAKRITAKIEAGHPSIPGQPHPRKADLEKRLSEYDKSMKLLVFTLETGRPVKLKGEETSGGVVVSPPNGEMKMEGK